MIAQDLLNIYYIVLGIHTAISTIIIVTGFLRKTNRTRFLPLLYIANLGVFVVTSFVGSVYFDISRTLEMVAFFGYAIIASYVITIEIPGYVLLSRHDDKLLDVLQDIRKKVVSLKYNLENIPTLQAICQKNQNQLQDIYIFDILDEFTKSCNTINNLDTSLYEVALKEISDRINLVSKRSKHPFPKLIEIMSLAGISFLLSQFLNHFFT